jgi:hypothetical protein
VCRDGYPVALRAIKGLRAKASYVRGCEAFDEHGENGRDMAIAEERLNDPAWAYTSCTFDALGFTFALRASDESFGRYLARVFRPLRTEKPAEHIYSLIDNGERQSPRYSQYFDDQAILETDAVAYLHNQVIWHVNLQVATKTTRYLMFHSSAAAFGGRAMIFPASMESGKSTLVTGLVRAGCSYLTDEAVALDPDTGNIVPFTRSISLDPGSWTLFPELEPKPEPGEADLSGSQWQIDPESIRPGACADACPPALIVSPKYSASADNELTPIRRADALVMLIENNFNFRNYGTDALQVLARAVEQSRCYRLVFSDLDEACRLIIGAARELGLAPEKEKGSLSR